MIFKKEDAIDLLIEQKQHSNYQHVLKLTQEYQDLLLCKDLGRFSRRYRANESAEQHKQRMDIYISVIPSLIAEVDRDFNKPLRSDKIVRKIIADDTRVVNRAWELADKFYQGEQGQGVDEFLEEKWSYYARFDPNSIITIERNNDHAFPFVYESKNVINYYKENGYLKWFLVQNEDTYYLYDNSGIHSLKKVESEREVEGELIRKAIYEMYDYKFFTNDRAVKGARFAGVIQDPATKNETYLSIFHYGLPYLKKEIQLGSEFDLTMRKHVYPQRAIIGRACSGAEGEGRCINGETVNGDICSVCKGTGIDVNAVDSTQELLIIKEDDDKQQQLYPKDIVHYFSPPVDLVKFQEDYQEKIHRNFRNAIFSQVLKRSNNEVSKTATEIKYEGDDLLDTLYPFMQKYANLWMHIMDEIIHDDSAKSYFEFPAVIFPQTEGEILEELTQMRQSGAPQFLLAELQKNWIIQKYATDMEKLTEMEVKMKFQPFFGKTDEEIRLIIATGTDEISKALHNHFHEIFVNIEESYLDFYYLDYSRQKEIVHQEARKFINEINVFD